jgi:hypothetical protein
VLLSNRVNPTRDGPPITALRTALARLAKEAFDGGHRER